jgi:hypothetical protein
MNGKPKTQRAVQLTAFHCTHPDLDAADSALLAYLALNADFKTGKNSRPGNINTAQMLKFKKRGTINLLSENIKRGLIERTSEGKGRGSASVYRLCLESTYYPDRTPSGEELTEKDAPECTDNPISVHQDVDKCAQEPQEVCTGKPENDLKGAPGCNTPPTSPEDIPPPPPPTHSQNGGGGFSSQEQATIDAKKLAAACPKIAFGMETDLAALIREHGMSVVNPALFRCSKESFEDVKNPVAVVFKHRLPKMIAVVKADQVAAAAKKKTREQIAANVQKEVDELDRKSREEHERIQKEKAEQDDIMKAFLESGGNLDDIL